MRTTRNNSEYTRGAFSELEHLDPPNASLGVNHLHTHRDRELRCDRAVRRRHAARSHHLLAPAPSRAAAIQRSLFVHAALHHQMAQRETGMKTESASAGASASELISRRITELGDWRGKTLSRMRKLIHDTDPDVVEEWKWMGTPVWAHDGNICTGESYKSVVKLTFAKGASLKDPARLFNSSLDGNVRRAIDIREGETIDASAFKALVREAIAVNKAGKKPAKKQ